MINFNELSREQKEDFCKIHKINNNNQLELHLDKCSWAAVFHKYMAEVSAKKKFYYLNFLSKQQMERYLQILDDYRKHLDPENLLSVSLSDLTYSLDNFLCQHFYDPFSCLIGLTPTKDVIKYTKQKRKFKKFTKKEKFTLDEIEQLIVSWSVIDDSSELQTKVRELAGELRGVKNLEKGFSFHFSFIMNVYQ